MSERMGNGTLKIFHVILNTPRSSLATIMEKTNYKNVEVLDAIHYLKQCGLVEEMVPFYVTPLFGESDFNEKVLIELVYQMIKVFQPINFTTLSNYCDMKGEDLKQILKILFESHRIKYVGRFHYGIDS